MDDDASISTNAHAEGYGLETDWWSLGAMLYELAFGVAPFFAQDIRQTYLKILNYNTSLRFPPLPTVPADLRDFLAQLLCDAELRLGRLGAKDVMMHIYFETVDWKSLPTASAPVNLHLPQFTYANPTQDFENSGLPNSSQAFGFSAFFDQSSQESSIGLPVLHSTPSNRLASSINSPPAASSFIGFSWGPPQDAFSGGILDSGSHATSTPRPSKFLSVQSTPYPSAFRSGAQYLTPGANVHPFMTPVRPMATPHTLPPGSTAMHNSAARRAISDREAMKQLVQCIGMSARKKVMESGRKPRILNSFSKSTVLKKELRFVPSPIEVPSREAHLPVPSHSLMRDSACSDATESEGPPSPSPSPRPGSAMSFMSRRSGTPTITGTFSQRVGSTSSSLLLNPSVRQTDGASGDELDPGERSTLFTDRTLDMMDARQASLMSDISLIEDQLKEIYAFMS
ncbi:hypothetical protein HGRIS_014305 [Hohenbuehelia grisea]|uniref:Protein kinase domain-containing protein n=1 Tax=Hohenbuehelia grisea TaxID=104357 RepID=A0ABR3JUY4_9AGAR